MARLAFVKSDLRFDLEKINNTSLDPYNSPRSSSESYNPDPLSPTPSSQGSHCSSVGSGATVALTGFVVDREAQVESVVMTHIAAHTSALSLPSPSTAGAIEGSHGATSTPNLSGIRAIVGCRYAHSALTEHPDIPTSAFSQTTFCLKQEIDEGEGEQEWHAPTSAHTRPGFFAAGALEGSAVIGDAQAESVRTDHIHDILSTHSAGLSSPTSDSSLFSLDVEIIEQSHEGILQVSWRMNHPPYPICYLMVTTKTFPSLPN
ncbi:hypothetical protein DXG01_010459 [Tephrocybe rancida]|nr:hypothetical protein DXG01_010459 [Tephrocybe rancida]